MPTNVELEFQIRELRDEVTTLRAELSAKTGTSLALSVQADLQDIRDVFRKLFNHREMPMELRRFFSDLAGLRWFPSEVPASAPQPQVVRNEWTPERAQRELEEFHASQAKIGEVKKKVTAKFDAIDKAEEEVREADSEAARAIRNAEAARATLREMRDVQL